MPTIGKQLSHNSPTSSISPGIQTVSVLSSVLDFHSGYDLCTVTETPGWLLKQIYYIKSRKIIHINI